MESFDSVWGNINKQLISGMTIDNWTVFHDYLGDSMTIVNVGRHAIEIDAPKAKNIQVVPREDFRAIWNEWSGYKQGRVQRQELRDMTRFSKYIISILHWYEEETSNG